MLKIMRGNLFNVIFEDKNTGETYSEFVESIDDPDYKNHIKSMIFRGLTIKSASKISADDKLVVEELNIKDVTTKEEDERKAKEFIFSTLNINDSEEVKYFSKEICSWISLRKDNYEYELDWSKVKWGCHDFDITNSIDMEVEKTNIIYRDNLYDKAYISLRYCTLPNVEGIINSLKENPTSEFESEDYYRNLYEEFKLKLKSMDTNIEKSRRRETYKADDSYDIAIEMDENLESEKYHKVISTIVEYAKSLEDEYAYARGFELPF